MTEPLTPEPPRSGDDTHDLIDDALYQLAERRGKWLGDPIAAITLLASLIDQAERMIPQLAHDARENGATWHDIATALATSPEKAELRYSPDSPIADSRWPHDYRQDHQPRNVTSRPAHGVRFHPLERGQFSDGVDTGELNIGIVATCGSDDTIRFGVGHAVGLSGHGAVDGLHLRASVISRSVVISRDIQRERAARVRARVHSATAIGP